MWRAGDLYIGWTPIPPGIDIRPGYGYGRWNNVRIPRDHWNFVRGHNFLDRSLDRWILPYERNVTIVNMTVINTDIKFRGNRAVNEGMGIDHVRRVSNRTVDRYELKDARGVEESRIEGREVIVFRPEISKNELARPKEYLDRNQAQEKVDRGELGPVIRLKTDRDEGQVIEMHKKESDLLRESQEEEITLIRREADQKSQTSSSAEAKKKIQSQVNARIAEIRKKHEQEKAELAKRQKEDEEKISKSRIRKKIEKT
jgi:hypothetical protein